MNQKIVCRLRRFDSKYSWMEFGSFTISPQLPSVDLELKFPAVLLKPPGVCVSVHQVRSSWYHPWKYPRIHRIQKHLRTQKFVDPEMVLWTQNYVDYAEKHNETIPKKGRYMVESLGTFVPRVLE